MPSAATAQNIEDYVSVTIPPVWVEIQEVPTHDFPLKDGRNATDLLVDWQNRFSASESDYYSRYVRELQTPEGVEDNSTIKINFDPSYQTVDLHHIKIIRGGEQIDKLFLEDFQIYRKETDRDKLLYNGDLQMAYILPDVRVGDVLDYAFTRRGKNSAFGPHFGNTVQLTYSTPTQRIHERMLVDSALPVYSKNYHEMWAPRKSTAEFSGRDYDIYSWRYESLAGQPYESDTPAWHYHYPTLRYSSFEDWAEVGQFFAQYYTVPDTPLAPVAAIADQIRAKTSDKGEQMREALDYVQREIRYLGIEIGAGGYVPRDPAKVLRRRFGDCKDVTYLLTSILAALDIEGTPLLVDNNMMGGVAKMLPNYGSFDHIIVKADVGGKTYFLDATRDQQMGDLDHFHQDYYGKGLIVAADSQGLIDVVPPAPEFTKVFEDTFEMAPNTGADADTDIETGTIVFTSSSTYYGAQADSVMAWHKRSGQDEIEKDYLEYYQDFFPAIRQSKPMDITADDDAAKAVFTAYYEIPNGWITDEEDGSESFSARARDLDRAIPDYVGARREMPYALTHPTAVQHSLIFELDERWDVETESHEYDLPAFHFTEDESFEDHIYKTVFRYKTKADHITAGNFKTAMSTLDTIDDNLGTGVYNTQLDRNFGSDDGGSETSKTVMIALSLFAWLLLIGLFIMFLKIFFGKDKTPTP